VINDYVILPPVKMTPEDKSELEALCRQIVVERDPEKFHQLVAQLKDLLERMERRVSN
jgi:CRISPR/Cas system-associated protein Csm6